jgi:hypothetical protein
LRGGKLGGFLLSALAGCHLGLILGFGGLGLALQLGLLLVSLLGLSFFTGPVAFRLNGFLNALAGLLAGLGTGGGKVAVLGAVEIRPGV